MKGELRLKLADRFAPDAGQVDVRTGTTVALEVEPVIGYTDSSGEFFDLREAAQVETGERPCGWDGEWKALDVQTAVVLIYLQSQSTRIEGLRLESLER